jgi:hypothetical protein
MLYVNVDQAIPGSTFPARAGKFDGSDREKSSTGVMTEALPTVMIGVARPHWLEVNGGRQLASIGGDVHV